MEVELRHLRLVRSIAALGTATRAAGEIGITQSALSQQLLDLEERLGERLFHRTGRRMVPTAFGERFLERADPVLDEAARMRAWLTGRDLGAAGSLRVATDSVLSLRWLPPVLGRFRALHPEVGLRFVHEKEPLRELAAGRLDAAITFPRSTGGRGIEMLPLFEDEMVAVLPEAHPLTRKRTVAAEDLEGQDFLYHMEIRSSVLYRRFLAPRRVRLGSTTVIEQPQTILELVRAGLGVTFLPRAAVDGVADVAVRSLTRGRGGFRIAWSAAVRRRRDPPWVDELVRLIRAEGGRRPSG